MRVPRFLLSSAAIACCLSLPALAEPTNAELDQRLRAVEGNVKEIMNLLKGQQASQPAAVTQGPEILVEPSDYQSGALYLDAFVIPMTFKQEGRIGNGFEDLATGPSNAPLEGSIVKSPESFRWGAVREETTTAPFASVDGNLQVQWSGVVSIEKLGKHTLALGISRPQGGLGPTGCRSTVRLNGKPVVDVQMRDFFGREAFNVNEQGSVDLAPGVYDFSLFLTCIGNREDAMKNTVTSLRLLEPGDRAPKPIPPERFGIRM